MGFPQIMDRLSQGLGDLKDSLEASFKSAAALQRTVDQIRMRIEQEVSLRNEKSKEG
jgi:regulator of replication initiation timing